MWCSSGSALLDSRDVENNTALHLACGKGHVEVARLCLSHGADVNAEQGGSFNTPQHLAAKSGVVELVELLIANGAEIDAWDGQQRTPLHRLVEKPHWGGKGKRKGKGEEERNLERKEKATGSRRRLFTGWWRSCTGWKGKRRVERGEGKGKEKEIWKRRESNGQQSVLR